MRSIQNFINGEFVAAESGKRFDKRSPLDNRVIASDGGDPVPYSMCG